MIEKLNQKYKFVLASKSPRRQKLLKSLGIEFVTRRSSLEKEIVPDIISEANEASELAKLKAINTNLKEDNEIIITADTTVECKDQILGKPENYSEAFQMLKKLSGQSHKVITGVCIKDKEDIETFYAETKVVICDLDDDEIRNYIERYKPFDKAGAYGIQEWIGYIGIEKIEGSYYNVVGLPVQQLYQKLKKRL